MSLSDVADRIHACWVGKAIGGTLGQSFEGLTGPLDVTFYDPIPTGMVANDDLDLQVVWAYVISKMEHPRVDRSVLADAWLDHVRFPFNEYGVAIRNLEEGIRPPRSGAYDNWFTSGEGAAIRSELWACLAWGDPALAAKYAYEDACVDHADDGIWAAQFFAALQASAFVVSGNDELLDGALAQIPEHSAVARSVRLVRARVGEGRPWATIREEIVENFGTEDFTDVRFNVAFVVLALLTGRDFSERILICTNCGGDTDSTTATLGALLGILSPIDIPSAWLAPIGDALVLSPEIVGVDAPSTLQGFTDMVLDLEQRVARAVPRPAVADAELDHTIPVEISFTDDYRRHRYISTAFMPPAHSAPALIDARRVALPGTWVRLPQDMFKLDVLIVRYRLTVPTSGRYGLMLNCSEQVRVWLDGTYMFGRDLGSQGEAGHVWPAAQHPPMHQSAESSLEAGEHVVVAAIRRPPRNRDAEWVIGLFDAATKLWIPGTFARTEEPDGVVAPLLVEM